MNCLICGKEITNEIPRNNGQKCGICYVLDRLDYIKRFEIDAIKGGLSVEYIPNLRTLDKRMTYLEDVVFKEKEKKPSLLKRILNYFNLNKRVK